MCPWYKFHVHCCRMVAKARIVHTLRPIGRSTLDNFVEVDSSIELTWCVSSYPVHKTGQDFEFRMLISMARQRRYCWSSRLLRIRADKSKIRTGAIHTSSSVFGEMVDTPSHKNCKQWEWGDTIKEEALHATGVHLQSSRNHGSHEEGLYFQYRSASVYFHTEHFHYLFGCETCLGQHECTFPHTWY